MNALFTADLQPVDFSRPLAVSAPFAGTRDGFIQGWLLTYRQGLHPPVPTLNRRGETESRLAGMEYAPCCFGHKPEVTAHVGDGGTVYLYHEGRVLRLEDAIGRGLAWRMETA